MSKDNKNPNQNPNPNENKNYKSIVREYVKKNSSKRKIINNLVTILLCSFVIIAIIP
jgi:phosphate transport system permease protein